MVAVPDLVGKTEDEAAALLEEEKLGKQMMGEENSTQEKLTIVHSPCNSLPTKNAPTLIEEFLQKPHAAPDDRI